MPPEIIACFTFPVAVIGLVMAVTRLHRRLFVEGIVFLLPSVVVAIAIKSALCIHEDWKGVEANACPADGELVGVWQHGDDRVEFRKDGTLVDSDGAVSRLHDGTCGSFQAGIWTWIVLRKHGRIVLLRRREFGDPDEWNLHQLYEGEVQPLAPARDAGG